METDTDDVNKHRQTVSIDQLMTVLDRCGIVWVCGGMCARNVVLEENISLRYDNVYCNVLTLLLLLLLLFSSLCSPFSLFVGYIRFVLDRVVMLYVPAKMLLPIIPSVEQ